MIGLLSESALRMRALMVSAPPDLAHETVYTARYDDILTIFVITVMLLEIISKLYILTEIILEILLTLLKT